MNLDKAKQIATEVESLLFPWCEKIHIAGGVRRDKPNPHDIEIVCIPKIKMVLTNDLFGPSTEKAEVVSGFISAINSMGQITKGKHTGRYMNVWYREQEYIDIFMPQREDYIRQLVIRTGSAEFVHQKIAYGWRQKGWCGTKDELRLISECTQKEVSGKPFWICHVSIPTLPPIWETEEQFFRWLGVTFVEPKLR